MTGLFIVVMENTAWPYDYPARRIEIEAGSEKEAECLALAQDPFGLIILTETSGRSGCLAAREVERWCTSS
ncbi:hypothetical protein ATO2_12760 [Roseovarius sp. 22II1-1F6A]|nr:hypothetical protein ATO2_12760 [Roseovarius sp. 22II1-1F6A]